MSSPQRTVVEFAAAHNVGTDSHNSITRLGSASSIRGLIRTSSSVATMTPVLILSVVVAVCCALTEKTEFQTTTELSKKYSAEDRLLANIVRAENSSQPIPNKNDEEELKTTDKKPRTVIQRDSSLDSRDKSILPTWS